MARLTDTVRAALGYWWNLVTDAARAGLSTTDVSAAASQISGDLGVKLGFQDYSALATLYGYASRIEASAQAFQGADPFATIDASMIGTPPYARDIAEQQAYPIYHVTFEYTFIDQAGNQRTEFRTSVQRMTLDPTKDVLTASIQDDAEIMARDYGHQLISAVPYQILAV